jgi:phage shock protein E
MNSNWIPFAIFAGLFLALTIFKRLGRVGRDKAHGLVKDGAKLVDVRSPGEFSAGHLPGAINVPLQELGKGVEKLGPKDKPIIVYCASGARSAMARSQLKAKGFAQVFNLGPMSAW